MQNHFWIFLLIIGFFTSCSKNNSRIFSAESSSVQGNQTAGGNGGNDGDWNQTAGGNGGYNGNNDGGVTETPTPEVTETSTPTATVTGNPTVTATPTPNSTIGVTATPTAVITTIPTKTATPTATTTLVVTATPTSTGNTSTPTATPTHHGGTCEYGCRLTIATNYDATANHEDGSCRFKACLDKSFTEYSGDFTKSLIEAYLTQHHLLANDVVESTCKTYQTTTTSNYCLDCQTPIVSKGMACPSNCSQKFTANANCYWSYQSCDIYRVLQSYYSEGSLKFKTHYPVSYCTSTPTKAAMFQYSFGVNYEAALLVKKLARPIAYAPTKLSPNDPRLKGKTYISFKNTIGVMVNADFGRQKFVHGKGTPFTPSAACTVTYEVRGHYKLNNSTGLLEMQSPGENFASVDKSLISVDPSFTQSPFWIRLKKVGNKVSCYFQPGTQYPTTWSITSAAEQTISGWDGQTVLNAIIGPKFQSGIYFDTHSLEGIEVYEYKQIVP